MRLQIKPGLVLVWRGPETAQIGLDPARGVVLDGLTTGDRDLLERLSTGVDEAVLPDLGSAPERAHHLVRLLAESDVLVGSRAGRGVLAEVAADAPRLAPDAAVLSLTYPNAGDGWELLAARRRRTVEVRGGGRTGIALATVLAAAGVGRVRLVDATRVQPADVGPAGAVLEDVGVPAPVAASRAAAGLQPAARAGSDEVPPRGSTRRRSSGPAAGTARTTQDRASPRTGSRRCGADLVVLVRSAVADSASAAALLTAGVPHLSVVVRERGLVVGPLVVPGRDPCLRCLDLHRADRDPAWPRVLAQLTGPASPKVAEEAASAVLGAALAALQVLCQLDGRARPAAVGATLEVELPDGLTSRRPWPPHPSCGCVPLTPAGHREPSRPGAGTMAT